MKHSMNWGTAYILKIAVNDIGISVFWSREMLSQHATNTQFHSHHVLCQIAVNLDQQQEGTWEYLTSLP